MPESPKFLLTIGRDREAVSVLSRAHRINKSTRLIKLEYLVLTDEIQEDSKTYTDFDSSKSDSASSCCLILGDLFSGTVTLFKKPLRRTTILLLIVNFALAFGYYGLFLWFPELFNRIDKFGGSFCNVGTGNVTDADNATLPCAPPGDNVYVDGFLTSISNLPGNILTIFLVERVGRKALLGE